MAYRHHTYRTAFYRKMNLMLWGSSSINSFVAAGMARTESEKLAGCMLVFALVSLTMVVIELFDSRPWQNSLGTMIGAALAYLAFFGLAMAGTLSWVIALLFVVENLLIWRYFVRNRPRPL